MILILMLGLGLDDMFVICNSLDQVSLFKPSHERLKEALKRAGPSITLTSATDALTFLIGVNSSIPVLSSFCVYCSLSVTFLYIAILTVFLPVLYWDTKRVRSGRKECFGLCCCDELTSTLFCQGRFLAKNKLDFSVYETYMS